ncbi:MAG: sulfite exporter TauE/SafE family protein [Deltaproteobacteria bacterium]|nr:sulfite exporter TauE/SafE family protein [Deltaproteobacteria bacterium]
MTSLTNPLVVSALLMGLLGGTHCVAMCGGVVGVLCSACPGASPSPSSSGSAQVRYWIAYNAGRLASYSLLGLAFAGLGTLFIGSPALAGIRFGLRAAAALCMLFVGLHLMGLPSIMRRLEAVGAPVWRRLSPLAKRLMPLRAPWQALLLGGLWGLMPCGLLYGALVLAASAETPLLGAETMLAFGVGTLPVMIALNALASRVARALARVWVRRAAGLVVLAFGLFSTAGVLAQTGAAAALGLSSDSGHCAMPKR